MISNFSSGDYITFFAVLAVGSIAIGWIAEGILQQLAFGLFGNSALAFVGGTGSVVLLDHAMTRRWIPPYLPVEPTVLWIATASIGAMAMILGPLFLRRLVIR